MRGFTGKLTIAALAIGGGYAVARVLWPPGPVASVPPADPVAQVAPIAERAAAGGDGNDIVQNVLTTLERRPIIAAKVRQLIRHGAEQLAGSGNYWQQDVGNQRRTCWQLQTPVGEEVAFYAQVYDGAAVWTDRRMPESRTITKVDLDQVRSELAMTPDGPETHNAAEAARLELLARGGMSQLVAELLRCFSFSAPQAVSRGDGTLLAILGRWRPEELARQWPSLASDGGAQWPGQLPHHVLLLVGSDNLFPYLVEYRAGDQAYLTDSGSALTPVERPLASYEFIDVQFMASMPAHLFEFTPALPDWQDVTGRMLERLRPPPAAPTEPAVARRYGAWR